MLLPTIEDWAHVQWTHLAIMGHSMSINLEELMCTIIYSPEEMERSRRLLLSLEVGSARGDENLFDGMKAAFTISPLLHRPG